jgi:crotonobetainyl-CoA:carnitine CoA-transferase CaiB-like acyl-CoA transferase
MSGPLAGVRILDFTSVLLGPFATMILGDMGADVIKIEAPAGDTTRFVGPSRNPGMAGGHLICNRNKRSLVLDLKKPGAVAAVLRLAKSSDVLVHNMRQPAMDRLGLGYAALDAANPRLVYCGAYGYSERGPYAGKPAYDDMIQGAAGLADLMRLSSGEPRYMPSVVADKTVGLTVVWAISMALFNRERTGKGQRVEVPMLETMAQWVMMEHQFGLTFRPPMGEAGYPRLLTSHRRPYRTKDGYVCMLAYTDKQWAKFFEVAERPDLARDARFVDLGSRTEHVDALYALVGEIVATRSTADWLAALEAAEIPVMRMNEIASLHEDPHLKSVGLFSAQEHPSEGAMRQVGIAVGFSNTPGALRQPAPRLGEHSVEVLRESGFAAAEIDTLVESGAVVDGRT